MGNIIAIGGGEIGRPGTLVETMTIDKEIIKLTGKNHPRLLFIPTASSDAPGYIEDVKNHFGSRLGCEVDTLLLIDKKPGDESMEDKIARADIIYVGGGNTLLMMRVWRRTGVDRILRMAYEQGKVLAGVSAGSICWFRSGLSDSKKFRDGRQGFGKVRGLDLISALHTPHFDVKKKRHRELRALMQKTSGVAIALENCTALEIVDDTYRIIRSKTDARAYKCSYKLGKYREEEIGVTVEWLPLRELLHG
jgi:dipeptidase E